MVSTHYMLLYCLWLTVEEQDFPRKTALSPLPHLCRESLLLSVPVDWSISRHPHRWYWQRLGAWTNEFTTADFGRAARTPYVVLPSVHPNVYWASTDKAGRYYQCIQRCPMALEIQHDDRHCLRVTRISFRPCFALAAFKSSKTPRTTQVPA